MPGSTSDPVVLDPLQTITEVGWPDRLIVLECKFKHVYHAKTVACSDGITDDPPEPDSGGYLTDAKFDYDNDGSKFSRAWVLHGTASEAISKSDVTVTGFPDWPSDTTQTFADWAYQADGGTADGTGSGTDGGSSVPGALWETITGAELDYKVPLTSHKFIKATTADMSLWGFAVTGSPICYLDSFSGLQFEHATHASTISKFGTKTFGATSIIAIYKSKAYRCIGLQVTQTVPTQPSDFPDSVVPPTPASLYLLLQRSKADDPS